jgi:hypothetical protein
MHCNICIKYVSSMLTRGTSTILKNSLREYIVNFYMLTIIYIVFHEKIFLKTILISQFQEYLFLTIIILKFLKFGIQFIMN